MTGQEDPEWKPCVPSRDESRYVFIQTNVMKEGEGGRELGAHHEKKKYKLLFF